MKPYLLSLTGLLLSCSLSAQSEFTTYSNGLIYSEATMGKLHRIVDSLNLKYKSCELNRTYYSAFQAKAHVVTLEKGRISEAKKDMEQQMPFEDFLKKYPGAEVRRNALVVRSSYKGYEGHEVVEYGEVNLNNNYGLEIQHNKVEATTGKQNSWLYDSEKESLRAFYFTTALTSTPLNQTYARRIGYSDCLVDTSTTKFKENAKSGYVDLPANWQSLPEKKKEKLLDEMRSTRVIGGCSMDESPRIHAVNIALLSAETTNWEVFLKSHLDIMNDRFDRMSDGSYAQAQRHTYIKELEDLDINVPELILGISLRIENPSRNHYYGNIGRLGRAISESKQKEEFETGMLAMMGDTALDDYNRVIAYFLYRSYLNYLYSGKGDTEKEQKLKTAINNLPVYLKENVKLKEDED
jgi:hypothetical protein